MTCNLLTTKTPVTIPTHHLIAAIPTNRRPQNYLHNELKQPTTSDRKQKRIEVSAAGMIAFIFNSYNTKELLNWEP